MKLGDMTPEQRGGAIARAAAQLQDELRASAPAIGRIMDEPLPEVNPSWRMVTCRSCRKHYRCTPDDDYYTRPGETLTSLESGLCLTCLTFPLRAVTVITDGD
jgi:hypothetical protein